MLSQPLRVTRLPTPCYWNLVCQPADSPKCADTSVTPERPVCYLAIEIESTWIVSLSISPVTATARRDRLVVVRISSAALASPAESSLKVDPSDCTSANDFVFSLGEQ